MTEHTSVNEYLGYHATPIITLVVAGQSEPQHTFRIYQRLLIEGSGYFEGALKDYFIEDPLRLADINVQTFSTFARWLYNNDDILIEDPLHLAQCYVLGDRLIAPGFKTDVLKALRDEYFRNASEKDPDDSSIEETEYSPTPKVLTMEQIIQLARITYEGTSGPKDALRSTLAFYVAERMQPLPDCRHCEHIPSDWQEWHTTWSPKDMVPLVESGLNEFLQDVLSETVAPGTLFKRMGIPL